MSSLSPNSTGNNGNEDSGFQDENELESLINLLQYLELKGQDLELLKEKNVSKSSVAAIKKKTPAAHLKAKKTSPKLWSSPQEKQVRLSNYSQKKPTNPSVTNKAKQSGGEDQTKAASPQVTQLEQKLLQIEHESDELAEVVNTLIPFMVELMNLKMGSFQDLILEATIPVIDEVIYQRAVQDQEAMSAAIASVLPSAISKEIQDYPEQIAKAIAPEMAAALEEQVRIKKYAISKALGPEMGRAIRTQIELERDSMVDALYPVIGSTVAKYMGEAVNLINEKVENSLSPQGISRKIRAKMQGVSEAELILKESVGFKLQAIFLIHKTSGLVISEVQPPESQNLESEMLAGMLTAIRSFANDCIAQSDEIVSELNKIDYANRKIILEVAGYCYLAVVVQGQPASDLNSKMQSTLSQIVSKYGDIIEQFDGDPTTIPVSLHQLVAKLLEHQPQQEQKPAKSPMGVLIILCLFLSAIFIPWGIKQYHNYVDRQWEEQITQELEDLQELSLMPLAPQVHRNRVTLTGRVYSNVLKTQAAQITRQVAPELELDNQIITVKLLREPALISAAIQTIVLDFNRKPGVNVNSFYKTGIVTLTGGIFEAQDAQPIIDALKNLPGVETVVSNIALRQLVVKERIYFGIGLNKFKSEDINDQIIPIANFLRQNPDVHLKIIGHTDSVGSQEKNQQLGLQRASSVQQAIVSQGIEPQRLHISGSTKLPTQVTPNQPSWLSRCVRFEPFLSSGVNE